MFMLLAFHVPTVIQYFQPQIIFPCMMLLPAKYLKELSGNNVNSIIISKYLQVFLNIMLSAIWSERPILWHYIVKHFIIYLLLIYYICLLPSCCEVTLDLSYPCGFQNWSITAFSYAMWNDIVVIHGHCSDHLKGSSAFSTFLYHC